MHSFSMGDPLLLRQARGVPETVRRRFVDARQHQGTKTDLCPSATVAEGQRSARDKIARYLGVGRATIERAGAMAETAEAESCGQGVAFATCAKPA